MSESGEQMDTDTGTVIRLDTEGPGRAAAEHHPAEVATAERTVFEIEDLAVSYGGVTAVEEVALAIPANRITALNPIATLKIEELMEELTVDYTIVIVTHNMQQAARVSQRTAFFTVEEREPTSGGHRGGIRPDGDELPESVGQT